MVASVRTEKSQATPAFQWAAIARAAIATTGTSTSTVLIAKTQISRFDCLSMDSQRAKRGIDPWRSPLPCRVADSSTSLRGLARSACRLWALVDRVPPVAAGPPFAEKHSRKAGRIFVHAAPVPPNTWPIS